MSTDFSGPPYGAASDSPAGDLSRHLLLLHQISLTMQSTLELDLLIHIILSACTAGDGLGFNRAFMMMVSDDRKELVGVMGVGPANAAECAHIWQGISADNLTFGDFINSFDVVRRAGVREFDEMIKALRVPLRPEGGVLALTVLEAKPLLITRASADPRTDKKLIRMLEVESFATVPLRARDEALGVIVVDNRFNQKPITSQDRHLLGVLAGQAAVAVSNSRLVQRVEELNADLERRVEEATVDLRQRYTELSTLYEVQKAMVTTLDLERVLDLIVKKAVAVLEVDACSIHLSDGDRLVEVASYDPLNSRPGVTEETLRRCVVLNESVYSHEAEGEEESAAKNLCVPLRVQDRTIGVLHIARHDASLDHTRLRRLAYTFANQAAITIENARLYQDLEAQRAEAQRSLAELRRTQRELIRKERLASLGEMAAVMAHEIRNPLTSIRGFSQRIRRRAADDRLSRYAGVIMEEVDRLNEVISSILDFARHLDPRFTEVDFCELLSETTQLLSGEIAEAGIVVRRDCPEGTTSAVCDPSQMRQVLLNLLQNAIQAMPRGGTLTLALVPTDERLEIRISDTGTGIPEDHLERIFEPFYTTKTRGTGLGLHLARRVIEGHHGELRVESEAGRGSTFIIDIPRSAGKSQPTPTSTTPGVKHEEHSRGG